MLDVSGDCDSNGVSAKCCDDWRIYGTIVVGFEVGKKFRKLNPTAVEMCVCVCVCVTLRSL